MAKSKQKYYTVWKGHKTGVYESWSACQLQIKNYHKGPFQKGTNNVGEFLALVHGLAYLKKIKSQRLLYTDSKTAMTWVLKKKCNTKLDRSLENQPLFELIQRAEQWLKSNTFSTKIVKWETKSWGEIPADFGRK